jgi:hypothetical protein
MAFSIDTPFAVQLDSSPHENRKHIPVPGLFSLTKSLLMKPFVISRTCFVYKRSSKPPAAPYPGTVGWKLNICTWNILIPLIRS